MAYRRSIIARSKLFYQQHQRFSPSLSHISGRDREESAAKRNPEMLSNFLISRKNVGNSRLMRSEVPAGYGLIFHRNMSKVPLDIVVAEKAVEAAPVVNEVATAAAASICDLNIIQFVQCYTGLEWWASIAAAALFMLLTLIPFETISMKGSGIYMVVLDYGWYLFFRKITFPLVILELVEKELSFKTGGILWLTDLTSPNNVELPILVALTFWADKNLNPFRSIKGARPDENTSVKYYCGVGVLYFAATAAGAMHFFCLTSNLFAIASSIVVRSTRVQKLLEISLTIPHKAGK